MILKVELNDRDVLIFKLLNKFRVLDAELILRFTDTAHLNHLQVRLKQLTEARYIGRERDGTSTPYIYFLRQRGMNILNEISGENERPYIIRNFSQSSLSHELLVADISYQILQQNNGLTIDDLQTDRELRKMGFDPHRIGDVRIPKFRVNIEVENTQKTFKRYEKKFRMTEDGFGHLWILNGFETLKFKLNDYIKLYIRDRYLKAILLDEVQYTDFDLTEFAHHYQKQQQFQFDVQEKEREDNIRAMQEQERIDKERAFREQQKVEEALANQKKPFWKK